MASLDSRLLKLELVCRVRRNDDEAAATTRCCRALTAAMGGRIDEDGIVAMADRIVRGKSTQRDLGIMAALPADALAGAGMSASDFVGMVASVLRTI